MNLIHMRELREHLARQDPSDFKMYAYLITIDQWGRQTAFTGEDPTNCKTAGCIAGHVAMMCHPGWTEMRIREELQSRNSDIKSFAAAYLALDLDDALMIFEPDHDEMQGHLYEHVTLGQAIKLLDGILHHGHVYPGMWQEALS